MEGDAGASRLNPPPMPIFRRLRRRRPKNQQEPTVAADVSPEAVEDTAESAAPTDATDATRPAEAVEDSAESADATDETRPAKTVEESAESADATGPAEAV